MTQPNNSSLPPSITEADVRAAMLIDERKRLTGIAGWLATFIILYGFGWFFGFGLIAGMVMEGVTTALGTIVVLDWVGRIAVLAGLLSASRSGSGRIRTALIVQIACTVLQFVILISRSGMEAGAFLVMLAVLGYHIAWLAYFNTSRRVRHTYDDRVTGRHSDVF